MKTNILNYINKLQAYKTAIKNLHWSSKHMSEHKLLDDIADSVANNQDEIAEMCQGLYGKIKLNELKPKRYKITNSKKMLFDLLKDTKTFYSSIKGRELTGVRSVAESFIGELNKFVYLMDMCIKEDIKKKIKNVIHEQTSKKQINEDTKYNSVELFLNSFDEQTTQELYSINCDIRDYKREIDNYKKSISNIAEFIQNTAEIKNINIEMQDYLQKLIMDFELANVYSFENDDDYTDFEYEIWDGIEQYRKYIDLYMYLDEEPNGMHIRIEIENMPKFKYNSEN